MAKLASNWSDEQIESFFNELFDKGEGHLKAEVRDDLFLIKSSARTEFVFTRKQFWEVVRNVEQYED